MVMSGRRVRGRKEKGRKGRKEKGRKGREEKIWSIDLSTCR